MFAEERKRRIVKLVNETGSVRVNKLAERFDVSKPTIRRDLRELENENLVIRSHGGAIQIESSKYEPTFTEKLKKNSKEKDLIGKIAGEMIEMGDTILLDSGTTTFSILPYINAKDITIITNSLRILQELSSKKNIELISIGGVLKPRTEAFVGPLAVNTLNDLFIDKAFIGANGISIKNGITTPDITEAKVKKTMIKRAKKSYVVADNSKFGKTTFSKIVDFSKIDGIIVDGLSDEEMSKYKKNGINIKVAGEDTSK